MVKFAATALCAVALCAFSASASAATLYSNNYSEKQIVGLTISGDGLLTPLTGSPFAVPDYPGGLGITPDGQRMIAPFYFNEQLGLYALGADGTPSQLGPLVPASITAAPAISPDGRFAYLGDRAGGVVAFAIGAGGSLTQAGGTFGSADGEGPALTPDGRFLLMPDYETGAIERFAVQPDGSLVSLGTTPAVGTGALFIRITPDGRFAVLLSDPEGPGVIQPFAIGADGSLAEVGAPLETVGTVSGVPALSPNGRFYYIANGNEDSVSAYSIGANGAMSELGAPVPTGLDGPDGLAMSVDGRFLYAEPGNGEVIQAFSVAAGGTLTKIGGTVPTGGDSDGVAPVARPAVPVARLTAKAAAPDAPSSFDATASSDAGATLTTYTWDFGDGTTLSGPDPRPAHTYAKAGVYSVALTVGDDAGCVGFLYTGQTAYCNAKDATTTVTLDTLPAITKLRASILALMRKPKVPVSVKFHYTLSENARVSFTVQRKADGRKVGGKCKRKTKRNTGRPKCVRTWAVGFGADGKAGDNTIRMPRVGPRKGIRLPLGAYHVTAVATDPAGAMSAPDADSFAIKRPAPSSQKNRSDP